MQKGKHTVLDDKLQLNRIFLCLPIIVAILSSSPFGKARAQYISSYSFQFPSLNMLQRIQMKNLYKIFCNS